MYRKIKNFVLWALAGFIAILNLAILISGKTHIYRGIANTYFKGRVSAGIDEYKIFDNRTVEAGDYQPWNVAAGFNPEAIPAKYLKDFEKYATIAYLIVKDDSIRFEQYWQGYSDSSYTGSFSMAKTFVSILTGIAIAEGKIKSINQPVGDFLPEFREGLGAKLTIEHLLTMSSGIDFNESYLNPFGFPAEAYYGTDLRKLLSGYKVTTEPGKTFIYRSGNTILLSFVLKKATEMTLSEYASEKLWNPIGAKYPALWGLDHETGDEKSYCCFNSNARDFARFGKLFLDSGKWNNRQIVPETYVKQSIVPANLLDEEENNSPNDRYGYSWWLVNHKKHRIYYARGILGQYIIVIPEKRMIVVRLGKKRDNYPDKHPSDLFIYIDAALQMYQF